jgi:4,5-DOPA dioxygenase extradiol
MALLPFTHTAMKLNELDRITGPVSKTEKMPVLFVGHGSPMIAVEENEFVSGFRKIASQIPTPKAILMVSAHWETAGTRVTSMDNPPTIHDFGGFPKELYEVQYPAPGNPTLAKETSTLIKSTDVLLDEKWGLDHGTWTVIRHMYPKANVPIIQLSIDYHKSPKEHYEMAKELSGLRKKGVLIVGSGNVIHNLRMIDWNKLNENYGYDWAAEANQKIKEFLLKGDHNNLINFAAQGREFQLSIPTSEHFIPLLYVLALQDNKDELSIFNDELVGGSLSMTSVKIG